MRNHWRQALGALFAALAVPACDPAQDAASSTQDGPTFLTVLRAATQPLSPEEGVAVVVQARGGYQVGINTYGGKHRYDDAETLASTSCAELPGTEPLYIVVKPDDLTCLLEARLYADCDPDDGGSAWQMCTSGSAGFIASVIVPITRAVTNPFDAGSTTRTEGALDATRAANPQDAVTRDVITTELASDSARGDR